MEKKTKDFEDFLETFTGFSVYQVLLCVGAFWLTLSTSTIHVNSVFLSGTPAYRCLIPALDNENCDLTNDEIKNLTTPTNIETQKYETCLFYDVNISSCDHVEVHDLLTPQRSCVNGYHYDLEVYGDTTITQWNLVCDRRIFNALASSIFFVGFFVGSWSYGPLSDWYGRKLPLLIYCLIYVAIGTATSFVSIFELHIFMRALCGAAAIASYIAVFTYVNEIAPSKHRTVISSICVQAGAAGHALVPGFAYAFKNWRYLQLTCSLLAVVFVPIYFFMEESPRWLIAVGREKEAKKIVKKFAKSNKTSFTDQDWETMIETEKKKIISREPTKKYSFVELFKRSRMRIVTLSVMFTWFTASLVFYGLSLNIGNLSGDPYVNGALNAVIEVFGNALLLLAIYWEKKSLLAFSFLFCGVFCLTSTVLIDVGGNNSAITTAGVALAIIGKLGITGAFTLTYSATADVFPTVIRATGMSLGSMSARIGSIITPFTIEAQNEIPWLTQTIFGCLSILAFFFSFILPKSDKDTSLTMLDEAEEFYKENMSDWKDLFCRKDKKKNQSFSTQDKAHVITTKL